MKIPKKVKLNLQLFGLRDDLEGDNPLLIEDALDGDDTDPDTGDNSSEVPGAGENDTPPVSGNGVDPLTMPPGSDNPQYQENSDPAGFGGNGNFDIQAYLESMKADIMQNMNPGQAASTIPGEEAPQGQDELDPEAMAQMNEEFLENFYANPMQAVMELADKIATKRVEPYQQRLDAASKAADMSKRVGDFQAATPDYNDYVEDMIQILESKPHLQDQADALEVAYKMAKADRLSQQPSTLEDFLSQEGAIDKIMGNDQVKKAIIQNYLKDVKNGNGELPTLVGPQGGGSSAINNPESPKTLKEAGALFRKAMGQ